MSLILPKNELENVDFCPSLLGQKFFGWFLGELKKQKALLKLTDLSMRFVSKSSQIFEKMTLHHLSIMIGLKMHLVSLKADELKYQCTFRKDLNPF